MKIDTGEAVGLFKFVFKSLTWARVAQLMVLGVFCGVSYFLWEARWEIKSAAVSHWGEPEIIPERLPAVVDGLTKELKPDGIFIWSVNVLGDTRRPMQVWIKGVRRPELEWRVDTLFPDDPAKVANIIRLLRGDEFCDEFAPWSSIADVIANAGITWMCGVGIPPEHRALVGVISVGFSKKIPADETRIKAALVRSSDFVTGEGA